MARSTYELFVVHVDMQAVHGSAADTSSKFAAMKARFPGYSYELIGLEEVLEAKDFDWSAIGVAKSPEAKTGQAQLVHILDSMVSATSKADVVSTLLTHQLVSLAKRYDCEAILFGDSTTRLAEKTLTETAKGRGFSLPWQVADGMSPHGLAFHYPLRDLLKRELGTLSLLTSPPLRDLIIYPGTSAHISASAKSTTIDELMTQYFESVEENYPSIVANVVRTASKLRAMPAGDEAPCALCALPVVVGTDGVHGWSGDQQIGRRQIGLTGGSRSILCYGCTRSVNG